MGKTSRTESQKLLFPLMQSHRKGEDIFIELSRVVSCTEKFVRAKDTWYLIAIANLMRLMRNIYNTNANFGRRACELQESATVFREITLAARQEEEEPIIDKKFGNLIHEMLVRR